MAITKTRISELVAQMPDVDLPKKPEPKKKKDGEPQEEQAPKPEPPPDPNRPGKFTGPDPEIASKIFEEIASEGMDAMTMLIDIVHAPSDAEFQNDKAGYVLHGLAIYLGSSERERERRLLSEALASALNAEKHSKAAKVLLIQEIQVAGGKEAVVALGKQLREDELNEPAVRALVAIRDGAGEQLRRALPDAKGRSRLNIVQALGALGESESMAALNQALQDEDRDIRLAAAWALAKQADASAAQAILDLSDKASGWERTQLVNACLLLAEKLTATSRKQEATRIYTHLRDTRKDASDR